MTSSSWKKEASPPSSSYQRYRTVVAFAVVAAAVEATVGVAAGAIAAVHVAATVDVAAGAVVAVRVAPCVTAAGAAVIELLLLVTHPRTKPGCHPPVGRKSIQSGEESRRLAAWPEPSQEG
eukprot:CAMPEP_0206387856 /NCGR_PEP_ID=MMETSP0294-20121207/16894_1 /ASSEMBLY_ACC=CAM_ASM_000327 /TAXON_ID=39354 /ORGANISM="Heterosigma akashiwo, Strain CCMP2393" /LENGTH=120 /DNA_ID=CAMNT_0053839387 /DNA_START=40 /DNA_END=403 /DNA_ORIENTATION=+